MLKVAIVEDEAAFAKTLMKHCKRYGAEKAEDVAVTHFDNPIVFLEKYRGEFDVVLMDILMPLMDGMECAKQLRALDEDVLLCFVTSMAQYAIRGYEVGAVDFIIKPVSYDELSMKLDRMLRLLKKRATAAIVISSRNAMKKIDLRDLYYVEVYNHSLIYHAADGDYETYGKLAALEEDVRFHSFIRVSPSHLVNCAHISSVEEDALLVAGARLPLSRRRRKECLEKMAAMLGGVGF